MTMALMVHRRWLPPLLLLVMLAVGQVWLSHQRYELAKQHQQVVKQLAEDKAELKRLQLEMASLTRPERLREMAASKLNMHPPGPMQVVHL